MKETQFTCIDIFFTEQRIINVMHEWHELFSLSVFEFLYRERKRNIR